MMMCVMDLLTERKLAVFFDLLRIKVFDDLILSYFHLSPFEKHYPCLIVKISFRCTILINRIIPANFSRDSFLFETVDEIRNNRYDAEQQKKKKGSIDDDIC